MLCMKRFHVIAVSGVFVLSLAVHFIGISRPNEVVFDEIHFGKFVQGYMKGEYYFDIHPPLGKLMFYGAARISGLSPDYAFANIGEPYPNNQYIWLRVLPALFGSLLPPLIYLLAWRLTRSGMASLLAGIFVALDNALLVQSKFILMDAFLLFFGFLGVYLFLESKDFFEDGKWGSWASYTAAVVIGCSMSVKWTAVVFWGLVLLFGLWKIAAAWWKNRRDIWRMAGPYVGLLGIPIAIYSFFFYVHFSLLPKSGMGDAFMTQRFLQSREAGYPLSDFASNFYELNHEMFAANRRLTQTHSYGSRWYTWPLMIRPIYYWNKDLTNRQPVLYERIYLLGNPFVWWASTYAVIALLFGYADTIVALAWRKFFSSAKKNSRNNEKEIRKSIFPETFLLVGYVASLLPFIFITRTMFLYHYFSSLVFAIIIVAVLVARMKRFQRTAVIILGALALILFIRILPVTYGTLLKEAWPTGIFWFKTWI